MVMKTVCGGRSSQRPKCHFATVLRCGVSMMRPGTVAWRASCSGVIFAPSGTQELQACRSSFTMKPTTRTFLPLRAFSVSVISSPYGPRES